AAASQGAVSIKLKRHAKFACRMLDAEQRRIAWRYLRQALRDRAGEQTSAGHAHRAKYAERRLAAVGGNGAAAEGAPASRLDKRGQLGH
ncbi:hypothetical protein LAM67_25820, partial [Mycobacterium tuberculosis]|nr:hypothetical protein [Mycobacterium tuberculosis]